MKDLKLNLGNPTECEAHSHCSECEHLLKCAEDDSAWTGDTLEEVRILAFVSAFIQIGNCSKKDEEIFLNIFTTRMLAERKECTLDDMAWAKNALESRRKKINVQARRY